MTEVCICLLALSCILNSVCIILLVRKSKFRISVSDLKRANELQNFAQTHFSTPNFIAGDSLTPYDGK